MSPQNPNPDRYVPSDMKPPKGTEEEGTHSLTKSIHGVEGWVVDGQVFELKPEIQARIEERQRNETQNTYDFFKDVSEKLPGIFQFIRRAK